ncbi:MAG: hypothetical protein U0517_04555 [Candidatus Andersenbacteria bacterium]
MFCQTCNNATEAHAEWCPTAGGPGAREFHTGFYHGRTGRHRSGISVGYEQGYIRGRAEARSRGSLRNKLERWVDPTTLKVILAPA